MNDLDDNNVNSIEVDRNEAKPSQFLNEHGKPGKPKPIDRREMLEGGETEKY